MNRLSRRTIPVVLAVLTLLPDPATGQTPGEDTLRRTTAALLGATVSGDRGLFDVAGVQTLGRGQYSVGLAWSNSDRSPRDIDINALPVFAAYGVTGRFTLSATFDAHRQVTSRAPGMGYYPPLPFAAAGFASGPGDVELRGKYRLHRTADNVGGISVAGMVKLPTASPEDGLGTGAINGGLELNLSSILPLDLAVHSMFGIVATSDASEPETRPVPDELYGGIGVEWPSRGIQAGPSSFLRVLLEYRSLTFIGAGLGGQGVRSPADITTGVRYLHTASGLALTAGYRWNARFETPGRPDRHGFVVGLAYTRADAVGLGNNAPVVVLEADTTTLVTGESLQITALAFDADNDMLIYAWDVSGGTLSGAGPTVTFAASSPGTYVVTVRVRDGRGGLVTSELSITVD